MRLQPAFRWIFILMAFAMVSCNSQRRTLVVEEGWELIGQQRVNFVRDNDQIDVTNENKFTTLKFRVEDRAVRLNGLKIYFTNGDKLEPSLDDEIAADQYSREIELGREGRMIDKVEFSYRTTGNMLKGRASVLIFARKYDPYNTNY